MANWRSDLETARILAILRAFFIATLGTPFYAMNSDEMPKVTHFGPPKSARFPCRNANLPHCTYFTHIPAPPLPSFLAKRHFSEEGCGGVYFEAPRGRNFTPPPFLHSPPLPHKDMFRGDGVGVFQIWPRIALWVFREI